MKKYNIVKIVFAILLSASPVIVHAQWAASITAGSADYEFQAIEGEFSDVVTDTFFYRDLGIDYSWDRHQIGFKIGGLAKSENAIDIRDTSAAGSEETQGDAARDEWSIFYTYRTDNGVALTAGYYTSELDTDRTFTFSTTNLAGTGLSASAIQQADKVVDNDGFFAGAAYGMPLSERTGIFGRLGYQWSDVEERIDATQTFTIPVQTGVATAYNDSQSFTRTLDLSGSAIVYGVGGYWAVTDTISLNLFYEIKDYDYSEDAYEGVVGAVQIEEEQDNFGLTLRYSF